MNAELIPQILVSKADLRVVHFLHKRALREGERFDHAIAQFYRESLWTHLLAQGPTAHSKELLSQILETRKIAAYEKKAAPKRDATWQEASEGIVKLFGDLPPIIPYTGPLEPSKTPTPNL